MMEFVAGGCSSHWEEEDIYIYTHTHTHTHTHTVFPGQ